MNGILDLNLDLNCSDTIYNLSSLKRYIDCDYMLEITMNNLLPYKYLKADNKNIYKSLKQNYSLLELSSDFQEDRDINLKYFNNQLDLFDNIAYIKMNFSYSKIADYIENNPELKQKRVLLPNTFRLDNEEFEQVRKYLYSYDNIYLLSIGNSNPVPIKEYEKTLSKVNDLVKKIQQYNYSPLEQIMYAYDLVRDRKYKREEASEKYTVSRDLTSVLSGDKIVCVGYANIFETIVTKLGFSATRYEIFSKNGKIGHERVLVYINDHKYNVEGVYFFDPTWGSKKDDSNNFFNQYLYFAKTKTEMEYITGVEFVDKTLPAYSNHLSSDFENAYSKYGVEGITEEMLTTINKMSNLIDGKSILNIFYLVLNRNVEVEKILDCLFRYEDLFNHPINAEVFLSVLYNVRKNEYYNNPTKYPFSISDFYDSILTSEFQFEDKKINSIEAAIFKEIFGINLERQSKKQLKDNMNNFVSLTNLDKNIEGVKLAKSLKLVYNKKISS